MGRAEFSQMLAARLDEDGFAELRSELVCDLHGEILEVGTGTGTLLRYYGEAARVTAIEPDDEFRAAAEVAAKSSRSDVRCIPGVGESLPFDDATFDAVTASTVLCSVESVSRSLEEFKRVLRPGGSLRLIEHVRSDHAIAGPLMDLLNPVWLRLNKVGCNWNRRSVEAVRDAEFRNVDVKRYKIFSPVAPAAFPGALIKAEK